MPKKVQPAADLTYNEAHTALQLTLAALQANDLDVEQLTDLYRQARTYLERCDTVLSAVEQEVLLWDEANQEDDVIADAGSEDGTSKPKS
ncbi:exodeoxyribonuclease VII small subunit [Cyanobium sp. FACHB-13342]|uniref:exodeoxyribonuclease VII small subunit n=1 Tax=Cyanobium sp. FACHB-13342 TaxID=2692793 RepID=UPI0016800C42|nr:exodeoxyribonuclease VII small subunit [Cyanobium sp. FACHB-13342]MBD2424320.1 exodeoxyribonuclease VII small subunit [Cyanobium sp. FACHB-13342]